MSSPVNLRRSTRTKSSSSKPEISQESAEPKRKRTTSTLNSSKKSKVDTNESTNTNFSDQQSSNSSTPSSEKNEAEKQPPQDEKTNYLFQIIKTGSLSDITEALKNMDVNIKDTSGKTALHIATWCGRAEVVELLIQHNAQIDPINRNFQTPLHGAAWGGHIGIVDILLKHGANGNARANWWTPLLFSSMATATSTTLESNLASSIPESAKPEAIQEWLISKPNKKALEEGMKGNMKFIKLLLQGGAAASTTNEIGWTPLDLAEAKGQTEVVALLKKHLQSSSNKSSNLTESKSSNDEKPSKEDQLDNVKQTCKLSESCKHSYNSSDFCSSCNC